MNRTTTQNNVTQRAADHESGSVTEETVSVMEFTYTPWSACLESIEQLYRQQQVPDVYDVWDVQIQFQQWFRNLIRQRDPEFQLRRDHTHLQQSVQYIESHYNQMLTVDELASRAGLPEQVIRGISRD